MVRRWCLIPLLLLLPIVAGGCSGLVSGQQIPAPLAHSVTLSWTSSASSVIGYHVYRGTQAGGPYTKLNSTPLAAVIYNDSTVQSGLTYFYVVTAVDSNNVESGYSNEISATIP
jgi:fibronectin type 3 domain-containing protein